MLTAKKTLLTKLGLAALILTASALLLAGCSTDAPLAPSDNGLDALLRGRLPTASNAGDLKIGPDRGGVLTIGVDGELSRLIISRGAVESEVTITAEVHNFTTARGTVRVYDFGPDGLVFLKPVMLVLKADVPRGTVLKLWWFNPATGAWEFQESVAPNRRGVTVFKIHHFSKYAIS